MEQEAAEEAAAARLASFDALQRAFAERLGHRSASELDSGTLVVVPSITFPAVELAKITAAQFYEERLLFTVLQLRNPALHLVYVTSVAIDPAIVSYYLRFLPDPEGARERLHLVTLDDPVPRSLSEKLLERPGALARIRALAPDPDDACVLTFNVTPLERDVCAALGLPLYGTAPELIWLGSKSGGRQVARRAGVPVLDGAENLHSEDALDAAVAVIRSRRPSAEAVVVKLNNGFSGQGSAIVTLDGSELPITSATTTFCAAEESWPSYLPKVEDEGAIVEEMIRAPGTRSPSVQLHVSPAGSYEVVSTHDQLLGGPANQVYLGCRFPADPAYRLAIQQEALKVAAVLADEGVVGSFGIDFLVVPGRRDDSGVVLTEINLRMGGTTHPFWMARLATEGTYDQTTGSLVSGGRPKFYVATDNFKSPALVGTPPGRLIERIDSVGLGFDPSTRKGATLHLLGALPGYGKVGATCIADSPEEAEDLYRRVTEVVLGPPP
ncbi:MAG TPA: peptide ligase PGM1-related protein [Acidimicrobiales bacterium]|nr:peptide ligase PGM1-related protein [Acidimicrobiales bacterium]